MLKDRPIGMTELQDINIARGASDVALTFALMERVHQEYPEKGEEAARLIYRIACLIFGKDVSPNMEALAVEAYKASIKDFKPRA